MNLRRAARVAEPVLRDLRLALRALTRKPGIGILAIASLGLAIGFSTAAFSILDAYDLRDLPVRSPRSLMWIYALTREQRPDPLSWIEYQALAARSRSFTAILAQDRQGPRVRLPDRDDFPITSAVSDNFFDVLGVRAARGAVFHEGRGVDGTAVVTDHYWQTALAGDPTVIGRVLPVGRAMLRIIGVLPPGFAGPDRGLRVDLFVPHQVLFGSLGYSRPDDPRATDFELLGRLRAGVSAEAARAEAGAILRQVEAEGRAPAAGRNPVLRAFVNPSAATDAVLLVVAALLILIGGANLANLRLVENESRRREIAIRLALGARRRALARQQLAESFVLGGFGLLAGLLLADWLINLAPALFYGGQSYIDYGIRLDLRTFAFSCAALAAVTMLGAIVPLADAWKRSFSAALEGGRSTRASSWLGALVVAQIALVTGGAATSGLLLRTLDNVAAIRPAMDPDRALVLATGSWGRQDRTGGTAALAGQIAGTPGVGGVAWARRAMLAGSGGGAHVDVEVPNQPKYSFFYNQVSPSYFAVTGARILGGRGFRDTDGPEATPVVMVSAAFARRFLVGRPPVGQWVKVNGRDHLVIGVVEDGPSIHLREPVAPYLYFAYAQMPSQDVTFFVASHRDAAALAADLRPLARGADFILLNFQTLRQFMRNARSEEQLTAAVAGSLTLTALLLAAAGLFGVTLFAVARRTREFGVRVAMGARPADLALRVLREAGARVALALPLGWALAYAARAATPWPRCGRNNWRLCPTIKVP